MICMLILNRIDSGLGAFIFQIIGLDLDFSERLFGLRMACVGVKFARTFAAERLRL